MKVVLKKKQFNSINEQNNVNVSIPVAANNISAVQNALTQNSSKILSASKIGDPILHVTNTNSQNGSNDDAVTQHIEVQPGQSAEQAVQSQANPTATATGGDIEISGPGLSEANRYTKKQIEESRKKKMFENTLKRLIKEAIQELTGIEQATPRIPEGSEDEKIVIHMFSKGWSAHSIAREIGCSTAAVETALMRNGLIKSPIRKRYRATDRSLKPMKKFGGM